jgi:hypothetical protein
LGRAVPYGIYDLAADDGWVSVGMDHDTAAFAVQTLRRWWQHIGRFRYPEAKKLFITADGGGSNGSSLRLWKRELQRLANELGINIAVSHFPPGTSKWNRIEHRLFSYISQNWRAAPLISYRVIVNLIAATTTRTGLSVHCELDPKHLKERGLSSVRLIISDTCIGLAESAAEFFPEAGWQRCIVGSLKKLPFMQPSAFTWPQVKAGTLKTATETIQRRSTKRTAASRFRLIAAAVR